MADEPIKPLSERSARYPEQTQADAILGVSRATAALVPFLGGTITELMSLVFTPALELRKE